METQKMQPTPQDVQATSQFLNNGPAAPAPLPPAPVAAPAPQTNGIQNPQPGYQPPQEPATQQPQQPPQQPPQQTQQPDAFANMMNADPQLPQSTQLQQQQPEQNPQAQQPTAQDNQQPDPNKQQTYEEMVNSVLENVPQAPELPDPAKGYEDSPEGVQKFFTDFRDAIVQQITVENERKTVLANTERTAWSEAFDKYPTLEKNSEWRDMVHTIRMGNYNKGVWQSPTEAADELVEMLNGRYKQGMVDNQVQTQTVQNNQTDFGSGPAAPAQMSTTTEELVAVQDGGTTALEQILANKINNGQL